MISIIICSRTQSIADHLSENIKNTVGCAYELVVIDNSQNQYSIFEAYNLGIEKSANDYLCFIHDDILFHTKDWGTVITNLFDHEPQIGLIGVAGSKFKTKMPSPWWNSPKDQIAMHIIQHFKNGDKETQSFGFKNDLNQEVVTIDGVFMAMRKDKRLRFSTELKGFHNYDLNICFECIKNGYKILVTNAILLEHFSTGTINKSWVDSTYALYNLYKNILPLSIEPNMTNTKFEVANAIRFTKKGLKCNRNAISFSIWKRLFLMRPLSRYHFRFWKAVLKNKLQ